MASSASVVATAMTLLTTYTHDQKVSTEQIPLDFKGLDENTPTPLQIPMLYLDNQCNTNQLSLSFMNGQKHVSDTQWVNVSIRTSHFWQANKLYHNFSLMDLYRPLTM